MTTVLEINRFLEVFEEEYNKLNNLISRWFYAKDYIIKIWWIIN
jgi:hypothetical protein